MTAPQLDFGLAPSGANAREAPPAGRRSRRQMAPSTPTGGAARMGDIHAAPVRGQLDLFPAPREVTRVDPREAIGADTRVRDLFRVTLGFDRSVHQVYHDRYGWYCAEHGPQCSAVHEARSQRPTA